MGFLHDIPTKASLRETALKLGTFTEAELRAAAPSINTGQVRDFLRLCRFAGHRTKPNGRRVNVYRAPDARSDQEAA